MLSSSLAASEVLPFSLTAAAALKVSAGSKGSIAEGELVRGSGGSLALHPPGPLVFSASRVFVNCSLCGVPLAISLLMDVFLAGLSPLSMSIMTF